MRALGFLIIAAATTVSGMAAAQSAPAPADLPPLILHIQSQIRQDCEGKASFGEGFIKTANFSPDGKPDFILDYGKINCNGMVSYYCGSGGCAHEFVVSDGYTYKSEKILLQSYELVRSRTGDMLQTSLHGSACGRIGAEVCEGVLFWRRGKFTSRN
jgi:hypothetical protein